jgi:hypothetical protein
MGTEISLSSNTLFHFTNNAQNLMEILSDGFKPRFCLEQFGMIDLLLNDLEKAEIPIEERIEEALPMTCFCDLPISHIASHLEFYGSYGIGLTKEWAIKNGLTPLTYVHKNSSQINYLRNLAKLIWALTDGPTFTPYNDPRNQLFELAGFFKPYEGEMWRINKYVTKRFYDEREWRYIPFIIPESSEDFKEDYRLNKEEFLNEVKRAKANKYVAENHPLKFGFEDIKYIIIKSDLEAQAMTETINSLSFSNKEKNLLVTKIISTQQIKEDF